MTKRPPDHSTTKPKGFSQHYKNVFAGSTSSSISRFVGQPFEIIKIRFQLQQTRLDEELLRRHPAVYRSIPDAFKKIYAKEGVRGFWRGHLMSQMQGFFEGVTMFWTYEQVHTMLNKSPVGGLPRVCHFMSGFTTGTIVSLLYSPLDIITTRLIASRKKHVRLTVAKAFREIYASGGLLTFYSGGYAAVINSGSLVALKFMHYNIWCDLGMRLSGTKTREELPTPILLTAGAASGVLSYVVIYPLDLVKRRLQINSVNTSSDSSKEICKRIIQCIRLVLKQEGLKGLYRGFLPCVIKSAVSTSAQLSSYDKMRMIADKLF